MKIHRRVIAFAYFLFVMASVAYVWPETQVQRGWSGVFGAIVGIYIFGSFIFIEHLQGEIQNYKSRIEELKMTIEELEKKSDKK